MSGETELRQREDGDFEYELPETVEQPEIVEVTPAQIVEAAKAALDAAGFLETASKSEFLTDSLAKGGLVIDKVSLDKFLEFRAEVIKAFKHLGLDTRKHFRQDV